MFGELYYVYGNWICENRWYNQRGIYAMRKEERSEKNRDKEERIKKT